MTGGFFAVLDDIAILLDDAAVMSKVAAKKTAGILGDDLAVNAEKATGFRASRELPVIWAITKGSFINKLIILPLAFLLSVYASWLIVPILLLGGAYLAYEGAEKIYHWLRPEHHETPAAEHVEDSAKLLEIEALKIKSAIRTDFILSLEIVMIALGTVMEQSLSMQVIVVSLIALLATVGVYGIVALLVRMDDTGVYLIEKSHSMTSFASNIAKPTGQLLIAGLPKVIRVLGVVGTIAMLLVGGGMFTHNIEAIHHALAFMPQLLADLGAGLIVGMTVFGIEKLVAKVRHQG
jgi:hypothetical protein